MTKFGFWHFGQSIWGVTSIGEKFGSTVPVTITLFPQCLHVNSLVNERSRLFVWSCENEDKHNGHKEKVDGYR
jgi:hypothetical protein